MSADNFKSFVRWKFNYIEFAGTCADLSATDFRYLTYVLHRLPEGARKASVGDATVREEVPGHARRDAVRLARARIQRAGFWIATPGTGKQATVYEIVDDRIPELEGAAKARAKRREQLRNEAAEAFRVFNAMKRGELAPSPPKFESPSEDASARLAGTSPPNLSPLGIGN